MNAYERGCHTNVSYNRVSYEKLGLPRPKSDPSEHRKGDSISDGMA